MLAALLVRIGADLSDLNKGLTQGDRDVQKFGKKLTRMGAEISKNLTAPILAAGAAFAASSISVASFADSLLDLVDQTGLSAKTLQEFRHVANVAGVESDVLAQSAIKLTTAMQSGGEQSKQLSGALAKLGLSATTAGGGLVSMDVLLPSIIGRLQGISDVTTRNAIAADIFGKSWAELAPVLGLGAGAMAAAQKEANDLGLVMSTQNIEAADAFRRQLSTLTESIGAIVREIGVGVMPIMQGFVELLQKSVVPAIRSVVQWFTDLSPTTKIVIGVVAGLAAAFGPLLVALGSVMTLWPLIGAAMTAAAGPAGLILAAIGALTAAGITLVREWDSVKLQFLLAWTAMKDAVFNGVSKILHALIALTMGIPGLAQKFADLNAAVLFLAQDSLLAAIPKIDALDTRILKSADAATTATTAVTQLSNALASLPSTALAGLPGPQAMRQGVAGGPTATPVTAGFNSIKPPSAFSQVLQQGLGGSQAGQMIQAFSAFGPLAALLPVINGALSSLEPLVTALVAPLTMVGDLLGKVLAPVIRSVTVAFSYVMEAMGWLVRGVGKLIDSLPFVSAKGVIEAGQAMMDAARAARANGDANAYATQAVSDFADALTNVPRVLNINALRNMVTGGGAGPISPTTQGSGNTVIYITVPGAGDPNATAAAVGRALERARSRGGTSRVVLATAT